VTVALKKAGKNSAMNSKHCLVRSIGVLTSVLDAKIIKTEMHFASRTDVNTPIERTRQCFEFIAEFFPAFFRATVT
jgi:hypothetical protein